MLSEDCPPLKTANKKLTYKVGWLFAVNIKDPLRRTGRGIGETSLYPIHPAIFTETDPYTHYPSVSLLLAYTDLHAFVGFASACGTLLGRSSSTFSQSPCAHSGTANHLVCKKGCSSPSPCVLGISISQSVLRFPTCLQLSHLPYPPVRGVEVCL